MEEDGGHFWKPPNRGMVRGRGCNESFRAAVDRSYENGVMLSVAEAMEPGMWMSSPLFVQGGHIRYKKQNITSAITMFSMLLRKSR